MVSKSNPSFDPKVGLKNSSSVINISPLKNIQISSNLKKILELKLNQKRSSQISNPVIKIKKCNVTSEKSTGKKLERFAEVEKNDKTALNGKKFHFLKQENLMRSSHGRNPFIKLHDSITGKFFNSVEKNYY